MDVARYVALLGPILLLGGAALPSGQRGLRVLLFATGGVATAYGAWRAYVGSVE